MKKTLGIALLSLAACSESSSAPIENSSVGKLAVDPEYQAIVGGRECTVNSVNLVLNKGMYTSLACPKGEFQTAMECNGFSVQNGQANCPNGPMKVTLVQNGRIVSTRYKDSP